jgi:hypothetical protein
MDCLEGTAPGRKIKCRYCTTPWDGSSLVLGTMYSYDIFAAQACCAERYKVNIYFYLFVIYYFLINHLFI